MPTFQLRPLLPVALPALAGALYGWAVFASTFDHPGSIGLNYIAPGTDWMVLYSAIRLALTHNFALTLDGVGFTSYLNAHFADLLSQPLSYRPWVYPPSFLVVLLPFGALSFIASYISFQLLTALLLVAALFYRAERMRAAPLIAAAALLCPAASINVIDGQCGFLIAGLLVLGVRLMSHRPMLAGLVLGLLSAKPQFALLAPLALLGSRQWLGLLGAATSSLGLVIVSMIAFGPELWVWWANQAARFGDAGSRWVRAGRLSGNSVYACAILLNAPPTLASLLQMVAICAAAACTYAVFRSRHGADRRLAILLACTILAAPHSSTYDAILLTVAGLLWLAEQSASRSSHRLMMLALWLSPLVGPPVLMPIGRAMPLIVAGFIFLALRHSPAGSSQA